MTVSRSRTAGCSGKECNATAKKNLYHSRDLSHWYKLSSVSFCAIGYSGLWFVLLHICTSCSQRHENAQSTFVNIAYVYGMENWKITLRSVFRNFLVFDSVISCKETIQIYFQTDPVETKMYMTRFLQNKTSADYPFDVAAVCNRCARTFSIMYLYSWMILKKLCVKDF